MVKILPSFKVLSLLILINLQGTLLHGQRGLPLPMREKIAAIPASPVPFSIMLKNQTDFRISRTSSKYHPTFKISKCCPDRSSWFGKAYDAPCYKCGILLECAMLPRKYLVDENGRFIVKIKSQCHYDYNLVLIWSYDRSFFGINVLALDFPITEKSVKEYNKWPSYPYFALENDGSLYKISDLEAREFDVKRKFLFREVQYTSVR
jgi:hypothetical protein